MKARRAAEQSLVINATAVALKAGVAPEATTSRQIICLHSRQGHPTLGLTFQALSSNDVLVTLCALQILKPPPEEVFAGALGLTSAEARLARRLAVGETMAEAAEACGVTINTARWTMRALLVKTQSRNQSTLMALLARLSAIV